MLNNRADSSAYNNLFPEFWLREVEEGLPFRNVARIHLATLLKHELFYMYFLGSWPQVEKLHFVEPLRCRQTYFDKNVSRCIFTFSKVKESPPNDKINKDILPKKYNMNIIWILNIIWIISWHSIENCCLSRLLYGSFIMLGFWKYVKNFPISVHSHIVHSDCLILLKKDFPVVLCFDMILPTLTSIPNFIS